jgi:putative salt-induced outer membrane protein YdiY
MDLGYRYRHFFGERWYGTGSLTYFQDKIKGVDSRYTAGVGVGHRFWDNSLGAFSTDLGVSYVDEEIDGVKEDNPALRWGLDYNRFVWAKKLEFFYTHSTLFIPQNDRGTVYNGSTGLRMSVTDMITANLRVDVAHETDPAPDRDKTDLTYVIGIGLVF